jgi:hypothetical protein
MKSDGGKNPLVSRKNYNVINYMHIDTLQNYKHTVLKLKKIHYKDESSKISKKLRILL